MEAKPIEVIMRIDFAASSGTEICAHAENVQELVRCKDCKHRPYKDKDGDVWAPNWDDETCPCICEDCYYNWMPEDDFFCGKGERREDE